jgi:hypothetical protein
VHLVYRVELINVFLKIAHDAVGPPVPGRETGITRQCNLTVRDAGTGFSRFPGPVRIARQNVIIGDQNSGTRRFCGGGMRSLLFWAVCWLPCFVHGGEMGLDLSTTRLASFLDGEGDFRPHILFPADIDEEAETRVSVLCTAGVSSRGVLETVYCLSPPNQHRDYERSVLTGMKKGRLAPALMNGRKKSAWMYMVIEFERNQGKREVRVHLNDGQAVALHGPEYIGPQLYSIPKVDNRRCYNFDGVLFAQGIIGTDGVMRDIRFDRSIESEDCLDRLRSLLQRSRYIPARKGDEWVWSTAIELFIGRKSERMRVR